ncbi:MAG: serine/threonine protein kinase, partial [Planctomycetes bacterium]|nr:serine/threonine protein kinase [Planctomycetota bacterium]
MDRGTFFDQLRQSRLLTEEALARLDGVFAGDEPPHAIAAALIDEGLLTPYQAKQVAAGKGKELVLGQYRVLDELGQGGFGRVFKALHTVMDRIVAVKVIAPQLAENERSRRWFLREVRAVTQLSHPNIVLAYDANEDGGVLYSVMEYVDGCDLDTLVRQQGPLTISLACEIIRQAALALSYAHERGLVHRDIKPANLLIPRASHPSASGGCEPPGS